MAGPFDYQKVRYILSWPHMIAKKCTYCDPTIAYLLPVYVCRFRVPNKSKVVAEFMEYYVIEIEQKSIAPKIWVSG
ncbi:117_t:CDS:2 [Racocetra fulgida]|uniref:117_t:CDS:1 n=1 Tax=Racocetra fulgida TaxID=60492 RepID=A0A9N9BHA0_9GLOM|nr:117_t:CDS:2 [Racocetra fulgida]